MKDWLNMKDWLKILLYLIGLIVFFIVIALATRMHVFLAIPVMVIALFGLALLGVLLGG